MLGTANDVSTYRTLVSEGVSDYLVGPFDAAQIFDAIETVAIDPDAPPRGQMIAFVGAKGGVGSSTVAANVTWSLAKLYNDDAVMLDLDMAFGTVGLSFNQEPPQGMRDALDAADRLDEMLLERFMAVPEEHVKLLCSPVTLEAANDVDLRAMDSLFELVRRTAPFIIVDIPHGWTTWQQHAMMQADEIVLTSTLDLACLRDTKNMVESLESRRANDAPVRMVLNHQGAFKKTELSDKEFEAGVGSTGVLTIEHDANLFGNAANSGQVIGAMNSSHKVVEGFDELAKLISGMDLVKSKAAVEAPKKGPFDFLKRKRKG